MTYETSVILAIAIIGTTLILLLSVVSNRRRKAREEELQREASSRGWKFDSRLEHGYRIHRWTGSTEGVSWTAESLNLVSGGNKRRRRRHIGRWQGAWTAGPGSPILFMGMQKGAEIPAFSVAQGDGFLAQMAQKAAGFAFDKAVDLYFGEDIGKQVDAGVMRRVNVALPGFIVMATDVSEGERFLAQGFEAALRGASSSQTSVLGEDDRPWILMRKEDVSLARMERFKDLNEIDAFIRAGVALTRVSRFGRGIS